MIVKFDSLISKLFMKLPKWVGHIEFVRVGNDTSSFVRIYF